MKYLIFIFSLVSVSFAGYLTPELQAILDTLSNNVKTNVIVHLAEQGDLSVFPDTISRVEKINYLKGIAVRTQEPILYYLNSEGENVENVESFWLNNCISFSATKDVVINIVQREDVNFISDDFLIYIHDELIEGETSEWNINKVLADNCWRFGYTGLGIVVGSIDTGVDIFHLSLQGKWRSVDGWFDAISGTSIPNDAQGHGTHVMGIICGGDGFGPFENDIGIAPGVRFICAKAFDSYGQGQAMWIHSALQWVAGLSEPPQVLNNSWYSGRISTEYWNDCQNLKNLGVVTVFCIGELLYGGPAGSSTSRAPGSYPIVIGVGATKDNDSIWSKSYRGPAPDETPWNNTILWPRTDWNRINPAISAPGVNIRSAQAYTSNSYIIMNGTSQACAHVTGCVAMILQKNPTLSFEQIFNLITNNAYHPSQGGSYPNNNYGWGRLNCYSTVWQTPVYWSNYYQPDNLIKNYWWQSTDYIGNDLYSSGIEQSVNQCTDPNTKAIYHIKIENDGAMPDSIQVRAMEVYAPGFWTINFFDAIQGGTDITTQIFNGGWSLGFLGSGESREIRLEVTPGSNTQLNNPKSVKIISQSTWDTRKEDVVWANTQRTIIQPDLQIKNSNEATYIGNGIYNIDGTNQTKTQIVWRQTATYHIKIENDGEFNQSGYDRWFYIRGPGSDANWTIRYFTGETGGNEITEGVVNGTYLVQVPQGNSTKIRIEVTPILVPHGGMRECLVTATAGYNPRKKDVVKTITKVKSPWIIENPIVADRANGPNQGRHLTRVPNTDELHMVFEGDDGVIYAFSDNGGLTWDYENLGPGNFPCIGINYKQQPWIAFVRDGSLICKIKREDGSFKDVTPFERAENLWAGPPSLALATMPIEEGVLDYAYIVYPVYDGDMPDNPNPEPPDNLTASYIHIALFDTLDKNDNILDFTSDPDSPLSHPCVAVTPADLIHIAWQQGDEIWYTTNADSVTPENWQDVSWLEPYNLSQTPNVISEHPFVESYGDIVYVVWKEGDPGEIIEKNRYVWKPSEYEEWSDTINLSRSDIDSDNAQMSTGEVCIWQEINNETYKVYANIDTKIMCLTPDANNIRFANTNALILDPKAPEIEVYYCYTDDIAGDTVHEVKFNKYHFPDGIQGEQEQIKYYDGLVGDTVASPYCKTRTGFIDYGDFQIDYGNQLEYMLKYFDPSKHYQLQAVVYQDTGGMIRQTLEVEDTLEASIRIYPAAPETINIIISPTSYQEDLTTALDIIKTRGVFASLANFKVYEYEVLDDSGGGGSGQQSGGMEKLPLSTILYAPKPNPFTNRTIIRFQIPVKTKTDLKIFNSAGRLVSTLISGDINPGYYTMSWNGKDNIDRIQANGIYFIRLKTEDYDATKKIILVR